MQMLILTIIVLPSSLIVAYLILTAISRQKNPVDRLNSYLRVKNEAERSTHNTKKSILTFILSGKKIGRLFVFKRYRGKIQKKLEKAHLPLKGDEFITICVAAALFLFLFTLVSTGSILKSVITALAGWFLPVSFLNIRIKKRIKELNEQLGDAITLISNSLKAGFSFFQSIDTVSTEMNGAIAEEFLMLNKEISLGVSTETALENLQKRVESDDLELVITAIMIQRQTGGNLAEILDNIGDTIRERVRIKGDVRTLTSQGRISGLVIALIPPGIGVILTMLNPNYLVSMFTTRIGLIIIGISAFMELLGIMFIRKIVKIEY